MAQPKLPLRIKVDVRDQFDATSSAVQKAFSTLEGIIGLKVKCEVGWDELYTSLGDEFPDKGTFVPTVADIVVTWCDVLCGRLEDDRFATWTDALVDRLESARAIKVQLQVSETKRPSTLWSNSHAAFFLSLPSKPAMSFGSASPGFENDFQQLFTNEAAATMSETLPVRTNDDGWAEIVETSEAESGSLRKPSTILMTTKLPTLEMLPNPEILLKNLTPYILHVTMKGSGRLIESGSSHVISGGGGRTVGQNLTTQIQQKGGTLVVQGTHEPSLHLLTEYLQRWVKKDHQDARKVPLLRIKLHASNFGLGLSHDTITVEPYDTSQQNRGIEANPTLVLALIENVLGYHRLPQVSASFWEFKRDDPFE